MTDHVLVGLSVSRAPDPDPVEEAIRRDGLQRAAVELGRVTGDTITGRVGDHGIVFLSGSPGSAQKKRQKIRELAERASAIAKKRFDLVLSFGASSWSPAGPLHASYQAALSAAEAALLTGSGLEFIEPTTRRSPHSLRRLREELGRLVEEQPRLLGARFDRYLEAVAGQYGYRIEPARAQLELGFERLSEAMLSAGALDDKGLRSLSDDLDRSAEAARTVSELFAAYRMAVVDLGHAIEHPDRARRDRQLRGALEYIHRHYSEPLGRDKVARIAGFAPGYFSVLFKRREGKTFEEYVHSLRIERAKQLLEGTKLDAARVAELSGFATAQYFSRAFRRGVGVTPLEHRLRAVGRSAAGESVAHFDSQGREARQRSRRGT
jgi:AraC-like DNA-binding protein